MKLFNYIESETRAVTLKGYPSNRTVPSELASQISPFLFHGLGKKAWIYFLICFSFMGRLSPVMGQDDKKRPNIIFILTDDQRWDEWGQAGNPIVETPHLNQLAQDGLYFDQAYVSSAICTPSRTSIFLGQYERRHSINFNSGTALSPEAWAQSYPVLLRQAGYFTGYVGKNHVPIGEKGYQDTLMRSSFDYWYAAHGHLGFYPKRRHDIFSNSDFETQIEVVGQGAGNFLKPDSGFLQGAEQFLVHLPQDRPFCLSIALNLPHANGASSMQLKPEDPALYRSKYRELTIPVSPLYLAKDSIQAPKLPPELLHTQYRQRGYAYVNTPETLREMIIRRYQTITGIDQMVGQIRAILAEQGLAENTILIITSDHGIMLGEWGLGGKALNYESCLRVPLIISDPRLPSARKGATISALVQTIDLAPTMMDWAGLEPGERMQGYSLVDLMAGAETEVRDLLFAENLWTNWFGNPRIESIRKGRWKYIRYFRNDFGAPPKDRSPYEVYSDRAALYQVHRSASIEGEPPVYEELFDLDGDPKEEHNLALDPKHQTLMEELRQLCQQEVTKAGGQEEPWVLPYTADLIKKWKEGK